MLGRKPPAGRRRPPCPVLRQGAHRPRRPGSYNRPSRFERRRSPREGDGGSSELRPVSPGQGRMRTCARHTPDTSAANMASRPIAIWVWADRVPDPGLSPAVEAGQVLGWSTMERWRNRSTSTSGAPDHLDRPARLRGGPLRVICRSNGGSRQVSHSQSPPWLPPASLGSSPTTPTGRPGAASTAIPTGAPTHPRR